jgi:hypothetical protein
MEVDGAVPGAGVGHLLPADWAGPGTAGPCGPRGGRTGRSAITRTTTGVWLTSGSQC